MAASLDPAAVGNGRHRPVVAVFASDHGPGDAERATIMSQAGGLLARRGAALVVLADERDLPVALITSARAAGGDVTIIGYSATHVPPALVGVGIERIEDAGERHRRVASLVDAFVGLPGSLQSAASLYATWVAAGGGPGGKPVVLLNRNRAFEVVRGFAADVLSHSVRKQDRMVQFADSLDDVWGKLAWLLALE